jgi:predicted RND superfamily exporter protein
MTVVTTSQLIAQARQSEAIENSQLISLLIALSGAMLLLVIHYTIYIRRPFIGVITVLPVIFVLALTFGTMAITGIPINPVTATLAALSIGIGVPYTIHFTSRFLEERVQKNDCNAALRRTVSQTGGALAGSALTTAIGFGVLITSTLIPFQQLGYVIVYAITYSLMASILVLPSMLTLWDKWDRRRHG